MNMYWGSGDLAPRIRELGTRWRLVVRFTYRPFYLWYESRRYPLARRMGWIPELVSTRWQRGKSHHCPCWELNPCRSGSNPWEILHFPLIGKPVHSLSHFQKFL